MVDDYGYDGIDFRQDPYLVLPNDDDWGTSLGKKQVISLHSIFYIYFYFIIFFGVGHNKTLHL